MDLNCFDGAGDMVSYFQGINIFDEEEKLPHNAKTAQDQGKYEERYNELVSEFSEIEVKLSDIQDEILERSARKEKTRCFLYELRRTGDVVTEFEGGLWSTTIESVTVGRDSAFTFLFRDGTRIRIPADK